MNDLSERERQRLVDDYLRRLADELTDAPADVRRELLDDLRGHIDEAWADSPDKSRAALLDLLRRLGEPEALAREERERLGLGEPPTRRGAGLLEVAAVALTALFWPVGVLLAWLSPRWLVRDKVVATLLPLLGLALTLALSAVAVSSYTSGPVVTRAVVTEVSLNEGTAPTEAGPTSVAAPVVVTPAAPAGESGRSSPAGGAAAVLAGGLSLYGVFGAPFTAALYLALRLGRPARRAVAPLLALVGALVAAAVVALALWLPASGAANGG